MKKIVSILMAAAMVFALAGCTPPEPPTEPTNPTPAPTDPPTEPPTDPTDPPIVIPAVEGSANVFYQIFVGSFSDSNGDGIGDLRGIINRFDYLNDGDPLSETSLGIEGIWLTPIFDSPSYHKYDAKDYYTVDPKFGTEEDLRELIDLAHSRGVKIILDLVINHTASSHPWFTEFRKAHIAGDTENPYYDYYSWTDNPTKNKFGPIGNSGHHYECNFSGSMPELNYDNQEVRQAMVDLAKYYLDLGVDGFRFDAAKYIYMGDEPRNAEFWQWYMAQLRAIKPDIYTVAEVWDGDGVTIPYFAATNCFNFSMSQVSGQIANTAKAGDVNVFTDYTQLYLSRIKEQNTDAMLISFIANHDMDRAAGFLTVASGQAKVAANLLLLSPGSPFIYYGEEIGLKGSRGGANTDANRRLAMNWGDGDTVANPEGTTYSSGQTNGTVAEHLTNPESLFHHYRKLILIRKANPEIAYGEYQALTVPDSKAGGFLSTWNGNTVAVFHNTTTRTMTIDLSAVTDVELTALAAVVGAGASLEGNILTIEGQTSVVLR
ncbi:MAG: hypothetical protein IKC09_02160 [Oscillospiraceae bacterium]|nr:hypothetical protein [Oscillospiraceae bacterium]